MFTVPEVGVLALSLRLQDKGVTKRAHKQADVLLSAVCRELVLLQLCFQQKPRQGYKDRLSLWGGCFSSPPPRGFHFTGIRDHHHHHCTTDRKIILSLNPCLLMRNALKKNDKRCLRFFCRVNMPSSKFVTSPNFMKTFCQYFERTFSITLVTCV